MGYMMNWRMAGLADWLAGWLVGWLHEGSSVRANNALVLFLS